GHDEVGIVDVVPELTSEVENVPESPCADEPDPGASPFNHCVGHQRGAVDYAGRVLHLKTAGRHSFQAGPDAQPRVIRRREHLLNHELVALVIECGQIGERTTDVDSNPKLPASIHVSPEFAVNLDLRFSVATR